MRMYWLTRPLVPGLSTPPEVVRVKLRWSSGYSPCTWRITAPLCAESMVFSMMYQPSSGAVIVSGWESADRMASPSTSRVEPRSRRTWTGTWLSAYVSTTGGGTSRRASSCVSASRWPGVSRSEASKRCSSAWRASSSRRLAALLRSELAALSMKPACAARVASLLPSASATSTRISSPAWAVKARRGRTSCATLPDWIGSLLAVTYDGGSAMAALTATGTTNSRASATPITAKERRRARV